MREEDVTMALIEWLKKEQWKILSFDYPGSGTGLRLHKNGIRYRSKDTIVPDIIAVKNGIACFFEDKDHFCLKDFEKQYSNIHDKFFSNDVDELLKDYNITKCLWGIGMPESKYTKKVKDYENKVDFLITVDEDKFISIKKMKEM